ncbi:MAG: hypothetical protein RBT65_16755 [Methanolobus sp.]|nr:hypothetical protein [Methanolobus sp.]
MTTYNQSWYTVKEIWEYVDNKDGAVQAENYQYVINVKLLILLLCMLRKQYPWKVKENGSKKVIFAITVIILNLLAI